MQKNEALILIPARLASTRFPSKPLADILGKPMLQRVYEKALAAEVGPVIIACDGEELATAIKKFGGDFVITDPDLPSGTDRIFAALKKNSTLKKYKIIVNLQGDLPEIDPALIKAAVALAQNPECDIATLASVIKTRDEITNPNVVKVAFAQHDGSSGRALYFSRSAIPYSKNDTDNYYKHIGIYAYKREALERFVKLAPSKLELRESLEQLRALENDMKIIVEVVDSYPASVDTKQDLEDLIASIRRK